MTDSPRDRHMLIAVTRHADGSQSSRIYGMTADQLDSIVEPLGEPDYRTHIPASARQGADEVVQRVRAASIVIGRDQ